MALELLEPSVKPARASSAIATNEVDSEVEAVAVPVIAAAAAAASVAVASVAAAAVAAASSTVPPHSERPTSSRSHRKGPVVQKRPKVQLHKMDE